MQRILVNCFVVLAIAVLPFGCFAGKCFAEKGKVNMRKIEVIYSNDVMSPTKREKVAVIQFKSDLSYTVTTKDILLKKDLVSIISGIIKRGEASYRYEEMKDGVLVMYGETLKLKDKEFVHALAVTAQNELNGRRKQGYYSLEYVF